MKSSIRILAWVAIASAIGGCPVPSEVVLGKTYPALALQEGRSIQEYDNGDFFVVGNPPLVVSATRIPRNSDPLWLESFDADRQPAPRFPGAVAASQDALLVTSLLPEGAANADEAYVRLIRLSEAGELVFDLANVLDEAAFVHGVIGTSDGGSVLLATPFDSQSLLPELFLLKHDAMGDFVWLADVETAAPELQVGPVKSLHEDAQGNLLVHGNAIDSDAIIIARFTSGGVFSATSTFQIGPNVQFDIVADVQPTDGLAFAGQDGTTVIVYSVDSDGNVIWTQNDGIPADAPRDSYEPRDIAVDALGNIYVVGIGTTSGSVLGFLPRIEQQAFILKLDSNGNRVWFRSLAVGVQFINAVTVLSDGTVATTGKAFLDTGTALNIILFDPATGDVVN